MFIAAAVLLPILGICLYFFIKKQFGISRARDLYNIIAIGVIILSVVLDVVFLKNNMGVDIGLLPVVASVHGVVIVIVGLLVFALIRFYIFKAKK